MFVPGKIIKTFISKKNNDVIIRYPQWEDLDEVLRYINVLSLEDTFITLSGEQKTREDEMDFLMKLFKGHENNTERGLFAFVGNELVGICGVSRHGKRKEHMGLIGISVAKAYREEGIGRALMTAILNEAKEMGLTMVDLHVYSTNEKAYNLYKHFGFIEAGRVPGAARYKDGFLDEIWMYKKL